MNNFFSALGGLVIGILGSTYHLEILTLVSGTTKAQAYHELVEVESSHSPKNSANMSEVILNGAFMRVGAAKPELSEILKRDLFRKFIATTYASNLQKVDYDYQKARELRFNNMSVIEVVRYKNFIQQDFYQKMLVNSTELSKKNQEIIQQNQTELSQIITKEALALKSGL